MNYLHLNIVYIYSVPYFKITRDESVHKTFGAKDSVYVLKG